ncbi:hypothetical protein J2S10_003728 [Neobacillus ginsengisoli]|uniref:Uncharacterized protein n=1 Tax=Neobacillus ginsengisoli TaxID=904295 RepID=A0ABT9XY96_9BACI|nr:hypothetical protein [Neobacillus ginsengisoli]
MNILLETINKEVTLDQLPFYLSSILKAEVRGRTLVNIN